MHARNLAYRISENFELTPQVLKLVIKKKNTGIKYV